MHIGYIGLGKMGHNMVLRLIEKGHTVVAFDVDAKARQSVARKGVEIADSIAELAHMLTSPRLVWVMVPAFAHATAGRPQYSPVDEVLDELNKHLSWGDLVIEGGNSFYKDTIHRAKRMATRGGCQSLNRSSV